MVDESFPHWWFSESSYSFEVPQKKMLERAFLRTLETRSNNLMVYNWQFGHSRKLLFDDFIPWQVPKQHFLIIGKVSPLYECTSMIQIPFRSDAYFFPYFRSIVVPANMLGTLYLFHLSYCERTSPKSDLSTKNLSCRGIQYLLELMTLIPRGPSS